jgi:hypothetical protein
MPNPSGPDQDTANAPDDATSGAETAGEPEPQFASAEPTVVLSGGGEDEQADDGSERRYSAPSGFDVMSTVKIENTPDPVTEVIGVGQPRAAVPQVIPPRPSRHRSWLLVLLLIAVIAVLVALVVLGIIWFNQKQSPAASQEDMVRQTISDFDTAVQKGDLAQLRGITCGETRDNYVKMPDKDWASTFARVEAAKQYPVVASIDEVAVNDHHAEANVTTFMAYAPQVRSTRSFDLQFLDGRWKICEAPIS